MGNYFKAVFISPHLDDAVFSCGGLIQQISQSGKVLVINIFTKYLEQIASAPVELSDARYKEENNAAALLGYTSINLGELDAFFRIRRCRKLSNIFKPLEPQDLEYLPKLKERLSAQLENITTDHIYVPMGVGWHADHQLTFLAALDWSYKNKVFLYEDAPYCLIKHATEARLDCLNSIRRPISSAVYRWWDLANSFHQSGFVQTIKPKWIIPFSRPLTYYYLAGLLQRHGSVTCPRALLPGPRVIDISAQAIKKFEAINCYASQVKHFFCDENQMRNAYRRHASAAGSPYEYIERYWDVSNSNNQ